MIKLPKYLKIKQSTINSGGVVGANEQYNVHDMSYDKNGNILGMKRTINGVLQDNLSYVYGSANTNTLASVNEGAGGLSEAGKPWFKDRNVGGNTISSATTAGSSDYDYAGNLSKDLNKRIQNIVYNALNLPEKVTIKDENNVEKYIYYTYTGAGQKLIKQNHDGITFEYIDGNVYKQKVLEFIPTASGRALPPVTATGSIYTDWRYEYQISDHLGNLRVAIRHGDPTYTTPNDPATPINGYETNKLVQENHYDPWGLNLAGIEKEEATADRYQFNGRTEKMNLADGDMDYDTPFRMYDPAIGRFKSVDLLAETQDAMSPFHFAYNNPISMNDPSGLCVDDPYCGLTFLFDAKQLATVGFLEIASNFYNPSGINISNSVSSSLPGSSISVGESTSFTGDGDGDGDGDGNINDIKNDQFLFGKLALESFFDTKHSVYNILLRVFNSNKRASYKIENGTEIFETEFTEIKLETVDDYLNDGISTLGDIVTVIPGKGGSGGGR